MDTRTRHHLSRQFSRAKTSGYPYRFVRLKPRKTKFFFEWVLLKMIDNNYFGMVKDSPNNFSKSII